MNKFLLLRFEHSKQILSVGDIKYKATCIVRNEVNGWRKPNQIVKTYPKTGNREPYYPRPFPTGVWEIRSPIWTDDPEYAPVKIPTTASQNVFLWNESSKKYDNMTGEVQEDSFYHLHYCEKSSTTLGCIRIDRYQDAVEIAKTIESYLNEEKKVYIDVLP